MLSSREAHKPQRSIYKVLRVQNVLRGRGEKAASVRGGDVPGPAAPESRGRGRWRGAGDRGLRGALENCGSRIRLIPVNDLGILHDADTPEDYRALLQYHNEQLVRPVLSVSLAREKVFFDGRAATLLQLIDETHSVRTACQRMQMSYSSGWNVIRTLESQIGRTLIRRSQGGAGGGKSSLTEDGRLLLERYGLYSEALRKTADGLFEEYFEGMF